MKILLWSLALQIHQQHLETKISEKEKRQKKRNVKLETENKYTKEEYRRLESSRYAYNQPCYDKLSENSHVIVNYEGDHFPGLVLKKESEGTEIMVMTMVGADHWKWPEKEDKLFYNIDDIVCVIEPPTLTNARGHYHVPEISSFKEK